MILLRRDCLVFKTTEGENILCPVEDITVEVMGEAVKLLDHEVVQNAAEAVLHYFKFEQGRTLITIGEFTEALEMVLGRLGLKVSVDEAEDKTPGAGETDLRRLARESGKGFELLFFSRLREELRCQLNHSPSMVRFSGLRECVKQLVGAQRWSARCQRLNDQIVEYLRTSLSSESHPPECALVVD